MNDIEWKDLFVVKLFHKAEDEQGTINENLVEEADQYKSVKLQNIQTENHILVRKNIYDNSCLENDKSSC
jgi:hypothetical protein